MGDERAGGGSAGDILQDGCLDLGIAGLVEDAAHGAHNDGSLLEGLLDTLVDDEVNIALAVA